MTATKTQTITVRIEPAVKDGLKRAAELERRSLANMLEVLIRDHCQRNGIPVGSAKMQPDLDEIVTNNQKKMIKEPDRGGD